MATSEETEVKEVDDTTEEEEVEETETQDPSSDPETPEEGEPETESESETTDEEEEEKEPEEEVAEEVEPVAPVVETVSDTDKKELKRLPNETPREYAMRQEIARLKGDKREERRSELLGSEHAVPKTAPNPKEEILKKYSPEVVNQLKEVIGALGYVQQNDIQANTFQEKANEEFEHFMERHPEYSDDNDPDKTLWTALKREFSFFKQPNDPRDYKRLLERAHQAVFDIKPTTALPKTNAAQEKVKVASHTAGSSRTTTTSRKSTPVGSSGLRLDMLKGFDDDEIAEIAGE